MAEAVPLRLGLLQYPVARIDSLADYARRLDGFVAAGARAADLLLMPEYACMEVAAALTAAPTAAPTAGPTPGPSFGPDPVAELEAVCAHSDDILAIMREVAMRHRVWLQPGTVPFRDGAGQVHNRAPLITPGGDVAFQDKHVMTRFEAESWGVRPGGPPVVFQTPWGLIGIAVCYDSEFPTLVRAQVAAGAWLILVPACTDTLHGFNRIRLSARARALENQCFVAVAPTVGDAPWLATLDVNRGQAGVYGPVDRGFPTDGIIAQTTLETSGWLFVTLDRHRLDLVRNQGAVRNHNDWPVPPPASPIVNFDP